MLNIFSILVKTKLQLLIDSKQKQQTYASDRIKFKLLTIL